MARRRKRRARGHKKLTKAQRRVISIRNLNKARAAKRRKHRR